MTANHHDQAERAVRFRGPAASRRSQNIAAAFIVTSLAALALVGVLGPVVAVAFFAVGAGAGYSLSGSV